jgi:hypothetical protein
MRTCVYTAIFGGYDGLLDQEVAATSTSNFICFTDDPGLKSTTWQIELVEPAFREDAVRSARLHKIVGNPTVHDYDATLYIDASVVLRRPPEEILSEWLIEGVDMAAPLHSYREQLVDEFDEVIRLNYDDRARVYEQLTDYAVAHPDVLSRKPVWTGMLARRWSPPVDAAMRTWADHVLRYSRRDQLSVLVALETLNTLYRPLELDNFESESHRWPVIHERRIASGKAAAVPAGPLVAELRRARRRIDELTSEVSSAAEARATDEAEAANRFVAAGEEVAELREQLREARSTLARLEEEARSRSGVRGASRHLAGSVAEALDRRLGRGSRR